MEDLGPPANEHLKLEAARNRPIKVLELRAMNGARYTMLMELTRKEVNSQIGASNIATPASGQPSVLADKQSFGMLLSPS